MSGPNVLQQFTSRAAPASAPRDADRGGIEDCGVEDCGAFGWLRGVRERAIMLELRLKTGGVIALGYAWLERAEFDPTDGITLTFTGKTVKITGRNLNAELPSTIRLFDALTRHRVPWIQESDRPTLLAADQRTVVVERIEID